MASGRVMLENAFPVHPFLNLLPRFVFRRIVRLRLAAQLRHLYGLSTEEQLQGVVRFAQSLKEMPMTSNPETVREELYEIPVEVYKSFLGKNLKLSSLYYPDSSYTLNQAEDAMLALYCERAHVEDGQSILDLGGGYGSLAFYVAHRFPACNITAVSYSTTQKEFIEEECRKRGLTNVKAMNYDISTFETTQTFDRIFAIQILEHFKNYQKLLKKVSTFMKPDGLLFIELSCHKLFAYDLVREQDKATVLEESVVAESVLLYFQDDLTIASQWRVNGTHQARASEAWIRNMDNNSREICSIFAKTCGEKKAIQRLETLKNVFILAAEMFNFNNGEEWVISHLLFKKKL